MLTQQGITLEQVKAIALQDEKGNYHLIEDQNKYSSIIEGFIEHENSACRTIKDKQTKWSENFGGEPFEPFQHRDELLNGDIVTDHQNRIITVGFCYCKESLTNLDKFIIGSTSVKRIDSLYKQDSNYNVVLNDSSNILRHKPIETGEKISISYYRKIE